MKGSNRTIGAAAEFMVAARLSCRGLYVEHVGNRNLPGCDLRVKKDGRSMQCNIEVKTTASNVVTIEKLYSDNDLIYVIAKRGSRISSYTYYTLKYSDLILLIEPGIGSFGKDGVRLNRLERFKDNRLSRVLPITKGKTEYQRLFNEIWKQQDSKARKKDGSYGWNWTFKKITIRSHELTRREISWRKKNGE